ncbi:MAG: hypothetical protein ACYTFT_11455 [Planctomycetota bacterium]|jgi:fatty acid desaturase
MADKLTQGENATTARAPRVRPALTRAQSLILIAAFASFVISVSLWFAGSKDQGLFVGLWVPSILALGAFLTAGKEARHGA